ncbi:MAG: HAMP domain-containing protein [Candidatus Sumerlaeia bacterium]|nr:HAMP domain-containing protein [Candidatus Sumerlaeia bacterium]
MANEAHETPVPPDSGRATGEEPYYPRLDQARDQSVRLIVSIPVLFLLIVLGMGALLYVYLNALSQRPLVSTDTRDALERAAIFILFLSLVVSLVGSLVGYVLAVQITRPIREMMGTMEAIATGDFSTKLEPIPLGEFGQLGSTFNRMVEQLDHLFQERDRQLRDSFGGAHLIVDRSGIVISADDSARRLLGVAPQILIGKSLMDPSSQIPIIQRNPRLLETLDRLVKGANVAEPLSNPVAVRGSEGRQQARFLVSSVLLESVGKDQGERILVTLRDISGIYNFYDQIQRADRLAAIGTLATGIAHEIRNPLASIRGMAQLLHEMEDKNDEKSDRGPGYHERILREVDRLDKLIAGIMDFAQTGETPFEDVDLNVLLREAAESGKYCLPEGAAAVGVEFRLEPNIPRGYYQADRLRQAFLNLILNAFQHCQEIGRGPVRIESEYEVGGNRPVRIIISNPGAPLDESVRERIFEPFYTSKAEGTGLGVPIAYQAINMNGGTLELESGSGEIRFTIRLPRDGSSTQSSSRIIPRFHTPVPETTSGES